jgi:creatinine amidohydrolase/Fe(II)-dependent formamide hydrolase-like protein
MPTEVMLANMTWNEVRDRAKVSDIAILPVGSTEEHGPHIALNSDAFVATEIVRRAAEIVADDVKPVIAPTIPYGVGAQSIAKDFPGTLFIRADTLKNLVKDVCVTLIYSGFRKVLIADGHGGNPPALLQVTREITEETGAACIYLMPQALIRREVAEKALSTPSCHADEGETSVNLALGNRVIMEKAVDAWPTDPIWRFDHQSDFEHQFDCSGSLWFAGDLKKETNGTGVMGMPTKAKVETGNLLVDEAVKGLAKLLRELAKMPRY